jgi:deoxyribonuclease V
VIVALDVDYRERAAPRDSDVVAAAVAFAAWTDAATHAEVIVTSDAAPAAYVPGAFYQRELPHLLGVLALVPPPVDAIVVDGYVWLEPDKPGLGARLYEALDKATPVIGVAKTKYASATAVEVLRGDSARPLYITAAGIDATEAAAHVAAMAGPHRIPTLLRRVDQLCRGIA